jgi:5-formyltetrahydrofolate cyclo-ligase
LTEDPGSQVARAAKSQCRRLAKVRIGAMSAAERSAANAAVCAELERLADGQGVLTVVAYLALSDEVNVDGFLADMVERGRHVLLPRVVGADGLHYGRWRPTSKLSRDEKGVLAPVAASAREWLPGACLVVVPGRAFDGAGGRVGRGGGYYDRILATLPSGCLVAGAAYECQVVEEVPKEQHDRGVDCLVTEKGCRRFPGDRGRNTARREQGGKEHEEKRG